MCIFMRNNNILIKISKKVGLSNNKNQLDLWLKDTGAPRYMYSVVCQTEILLRIIRQTDRRADAQTDARTDGRTSEQARPRHTEDVLKMKPDYSLL